MGVAECRMGSKVSGECLLDEVFYCCHSRDKQWRVAHLAGAARLLVVVFSMRWEEAVVFYCAGWLTMWVINPLPHR